MIKALGNPEDKRWIGDTRGLLELRSQGMQLMYELGHAWPVVHAPRSKRDPLPWVQVGGLESRLKAGEIVAIADGGVVHAVELPIAEQPKPRYITHSFLAGATSVYAVKDTVTNIDVASFYSRSSARDRAERLNASGASVEELAEETPMNAPADCPTHGVDDLRGGRAAEIEATACASATTYGAWSEGAGGFVYSGDCALEVANWAADELRKLAKEDDTDTIQILAVCREHEDQPASACEECNA